MTINSTVGARYGKTGCIVYINAHRLIIGDGAVDQIIDKELIGRKFSDALLHTRRKVRMHPTGASRTRLNMTTRTNITPQD